MTHPEIPHSVYFFHLKKLTGAYSKNYSFSSVSEPVIFFLKRIPAHEDGTTSAPTSRIRAGCVQTAHPRKRNRVCVETVPIAPRGVSRPAMRRFVAPKQEFLQRANRPGIDNYNDELDEAVCSSVSCTHRSRVFFCFLAEFMEKQNNVRKC